MSTPIHVQQLRRRLTAVYGGVWGISVAVLAGLTLITAGRNLSGERDALIRTHAIAVYGLTWLDTDGFHREVIDKEDWLLEGGLDVRVIRDNGQVLYETPTLKLAGLPPTVGAILDEEEPQFFDGEDRAGVRYRMFGLPAYDDRDQPYGAILVSTESGPFTRRWRQFAGALLVISACMMGLGLWLGGRLAQQSLLPLLASLQERELLLAAGGHELRTPLASLSAIVESAEAGDETAEQALRRAQGVLATASERLKRWMTWARLGTPRELPLTPLRLDLLVEQVIDEEPISLKAEACVISGDAATLAIAIRNLLENAQRHGRPPISIIVENGVILVEDAGEGFIRIEQAMRPFSSRPDSPGSGLGLDIVRRVAEAHGGSLRLRNRPAGGAQVTLRLPLVPSIAQTVS